jgi:serine phosphatase RsbU (regulator of sigma subunit)
MLPECSFGLGTAMLDRGQTLFAYTDGATDAKGPDGFFGRERLFALLAPGVPSAGGLLERIGAAVRAHVGDADRYDDLTMLAVRRS